MRFFLYVSLLLVLIPVVFSKPFLGLCVYYVVSILQPKYLCWRPDFQDALLVGIPFVIGAVAFGAIRKDLIPARDSETGRLRKLITRLTRSPFFHPCWTLGLFGLLIAYITVTRLLVPYPLDDSSYQFRGLCKIIFVAAMITGLVTDEKRFRTFYIVIALSAAFWAIKGGLKVVLIGPHQVYGKTYDNNLFALTSVMALPMLFYFGLSIRHVRWRTLLLIASALMCLGIIGSRSRAGFVAFGVVLICMAWSSRYRLRAFAAVSVVALVVVLASGSEIIERVDSIFAYSEDRSARARFATWEVARELFFESPIIGVGFNNFETAKDRFTGGQKAAHNIYLQNLSELGLLGTPIWLLIIFGTMFGLFRLMRNSRTLPPEMRWVYYYARGLLLALVAFSIHGMFHNDEYLEQMFVVVGLAAALKLVAERKWREIQLSSELKKQGEAASVDTESGDARPELPTPSPTLEPAGHPGLFGGRPRSLGALARYGIQLRPYPGGP